MTVVVFGIDALDPELADPGEHPNLTLDAHRAIETIQSVAGEPSTHELWPTIITGLPPAEHGLELDDGVAWENPILRTGSTVADSVLPDAVQTRLGAWLLNNTDEDAFRMPASYYEERGLSTLLDGASRQAIGVPNYVVDGDSEDREHQLRREMGDLFERDPEAKGGHESADPAQFYEQCMEMSMIRTARVRRGLRSREYELVFGYTSGLDLIGHVSHDRPELQRRAYDELDDIVGELRGDLEAGDELVLVSDHGLQDGLHTDEAMIAATDPGVVDAVESVLDVRAAIESLLDEGGHEPEQRDDRAGGLESEAVREQLEDLGYV
jgi:predicted AlkP superfamily pyrophosphatase or phosphodiesterase